MLRSRYISSAQNFAFLDLKKKIEALTLPSTLLCVIFTVKKARCGRGMYTYRSHAKATPKRRNAITYYFLCPRRVAFLRPSILCEDRMKLSIKILQKRTTRMTTCLNLCSLLLYIPDAFTVITCWLVSLTNKMKTLRPYSTYTQGYVATFFRSSDLSQDKGCSHVVAVKFTIQFCNLFIEMLIQKIKVVYPYATLARKVRSLIT